MKIISNKNKLDEFNIELDKNINHYFLKKGRYLRFWTSKIKIVVFVLSLIGFIYETATLSIMFINDIITENNIRLWNGFFPWWTIFFTFTFWSNTFVWVSYLIYLFFFWNKRIKNNNTFLFISCTYITLVLLVVAFILFPAAIIQKDNVDFSSHTSLLTLSALIMPHAPAPIYFIFFAMVIFSLNRRGNLIIINKYKFWKILGFSLIFFLSYMIMVAILNYVQVGSYYIDNGQKIFFKGYTVYSKFTAINPNIILVSGDKETGHGNYINLLYYLLVLIILFVLVSIYYVIQSRCFKFNYLFSNIKIQKILVSK